MHADHIRRLNLWLATEIEDELDCRWVDVGELRRIHHGLVEAYDPDVHDGRGREAVERALVKAGRFFEMYDRRQQCST